MSSAALETLASEHTAIVRIDRLAWAAHSRNDCDNKLMDGPKNNIVAQFPFFPAGVSVSGVVVKVSPLRHPLIIGPRSGLWTPPGTCSLALCGCGGGRKVPLS